MSVAVSAVLVALAALATPEGVRADCGPIAVEQPPPNSIATASSSQGSNSASKAFDGNWDGTQFHYWESQTGMPQWINLAGTGTQTIRLECYAIRAPKDDYATDAPTDWSLSGYSTASNSWHVLDTQTNVNGWQSGESRKFCLAASDVMVVNELKWTFTNTGGRVSSLKRVIVAEILLYKAAAECVTTGMSTFSGQIRNIPNLAGATQYCLTALVFTSSDSEGCNRVGWEPCEELLVAEEGMCTDKDQTWEWETVTSSVSTAPAGRLKSTGQSLCLIATGSASSSSRSLEACPCDDVNAWALDDVRGTTILTEEPRGATSTWCLAYEHGGAMLQDCTNRIASGSAMQEKYRMCANKVELPAAEGSDTVAQVVSIIMSVMVACFCLACFAAAMKRAQDNQRAQTGPAAVGHAPAAAPSVDTSNDIGTVGTATASSVEPAGGTSHQPERAFDGGWNSGAYHYWHSKQGMPQWLQKSLNSTIVIGGYGIRARASEYSQWDTPSAWRFEAQPKGSTDWLMLHTVTNEVNWRTNERRNYHLPSPIEVQAVRWIFTNGPLRPPHAGGGQRAVIAEAALCKPGAAPTTYPPANVGAPAAAPAPAPVGGAYPPPQAAAPQPAGAYPPMHAGGYPPQGATAAPPAYGAGAGVGAGGMPAAYGAPAQPQPQPQAYNFGTRPLAPAAGAGPPPGYQQQRQQQPATGGIVSL